MRCVARHLTVRGRTTKATALRSPMFVAAAARESGTHFTGKGADVSQRRERARMRRYQCASGSGLRQACRHENLACVEAEE